MKRIIAALFWLSAPIAIAKGPYIWNGPNAKNLVSNGTLNPDGALATPSYSFINDPDTGMYRPGTNTLALVANGISSLFVDTDGKVGVGTSAPTQQLQVERFIKADGGDDDLGGLVVDTGSSFKRFGFVKYPGYSGVVVAGSSVPLYLGHRTDTNDVTTPLGTFREELVIDTAGKVGINASSPGAQLEIDSSALGTIGTIVKGAASQTANLQEWQNSSGTILSSLHADGSVTVGSSGELYKLTLTGAAKNTVYYGLNTASAVAGDNLNYAVTNAVTGALTGFSYTAAASTGFNSTFFNSNTTDSTADSQFEVKVGGANGGDPKFVYTINGVTNWAMGVDNSDSDKFKIGNSSTLGGADKMTITSGGLVGIGTASPAASALLDLTSTTGALLLPRMTTTQRDALTAVNGMQVYNSTTGKVNIYEGGAWVVNTTGTALTNPMTTTGDIIYSSDGSGTPARLGIGASTTVLHGGTIPSYSAVSLPNDTTGVLTLAKGGSEKNLSAVNGGVVWTDADSMEISAAGSSGQYLKSNGAAAPSFSAIDISTASVTGVLPLANGGTSKNATAVNGGLVWSDADSMEITAAGTASQWVLSGGAGSPTMSNTTTTAKFIDGSADAVQLRVQGNSTQTSNILTVEKSDNTGYLQVGGTGAVEIGPASTALTHTINVAPSSNKIVFGPGASSTKAGLAVSNAANSTGVAVMSTTSNNFLSYGGAELDFVNSTYADTVSPTSFGNSGTIMGSIDTAGRYTMGPSSGLTTRHIVRSQGVAATPVLSVQKASTAIDTNGNVYVEFTGSSGNLEGTIQVVATTLTLLDASDGRLKENVRDASYGLKEINSLRPVTYDWIKGPKNIKGFVAQDVEKVLPELVVKTDTSNKKGGFKDQRGLAPALLIPILVKSVQELSAKNDALEKRLSAIEARMAVAESGLRAKDCSKVK